jgi:dynactin complex subunit
MGADGQDIGVGDKVDVPGGMHGVVKFIGTVSNKKGVFAGVELSREYATRGKNDGEVDGWVLQR